MTRTAHNRKLAANFQGPEGVRHAVHEGEDYLVVPVVMIVDGVLNGVLVTQEEYGKFVESWNGIPVPVLHPEIDGIPVSANQPDIVEKNTIGRIYNTRAENGKLKAEAWINVGKARRLGYGELVDAMEAGEKIEVSTGYFSEDEPRRGEYNGQPYETVARNIRPDHLALLPGEIGACSVQDGCGTRTNSRRIVVNVKEAIETLAKALGLRANCECQTEEKIMTDKEKRAEKIKALSNHLTTNGVDENTVKRITANAKLSPEQIEMLMALDAEQLKQVSALAATLAESTTDEAPEMDEAAEEEIESMEEDEKAMSVKKADIDKLVANRVAEHLRRHAVVEKLKTNERNPFSEEEMQSMSVAHLEKLERSIRPEDYSGQGGFATNGHDFDTKVEPLKIHKGVTARREKQEA